MLSPKLDTKIVPTLYSYIPHKDGSDNSSVGMRNPFNDQRPDGEDYSKVPNLMIEVGQIK
jgi:hypothetical protein